MITSPRWVGWLIRLLPARRRREYGDELARVWTERLEIERHRRGPLRYLTYCMRTVRDLLATCWRARMAAPPDGRVAAAPRPRRRRDVSNLPDELKQAARSLRRSPALTVLIVALLGIGIGGATAVFSAVDQILLRPFPFDTERIADVWFDLPSRNRVDWPHSRETLAFLRDTLRSVEDLVPITGGFRTLRFDDRAERLMVAEVGADFFDLTGAVPVAGRYFSAAEDQPGAEATVVLSEGLWRREFGSDLSVLGDRIDLGGVPTTVVGVFPEEVRLVTRLNQSRGFPTNNEVELYLPAGPRAATIPPNTYIYMALGRLVPGADVDDLRGELEALTEELLVAAGSTVLEPRAEVLGKRITGGARGIALLLAAAAAVALLIVCSNVAALLLVRGSRRGPEWAIRRALGGSAGRLARQLLMEGTMVAALGGAVGVALAVWLVAALRSGAVDALPRLDALTLDLRVVALAIVVTGVSALAFALLPAVVFSRQSGLAALATRSSSRSRRGKIGLQLLVVTEVALAVALTVTAVTFTRSFANLLAQDPGYDAGGVLSLTVALPQPRYQTDNQFADYAEQTRRQLASVPGVAGVEVMSGPPMNAPNVAMTVETADGPLDYAAREAAVSPGLFEALGMKVVAGRGFRDSDNRDAAPVVIVSRALAEELWPGEDPIGKIVTGGSWRRFAVTSMRTPNRQREIVGVVNDFRTLGLTGGTPVPYLFMPFDQAPWAGGTFMLRVPDDVAVADAIRSTVRRVDPTVPVWNLEPLADIVARSSERERFGAAVVAAFAIVSFLLALTGAYGVVAYTVVAKTREIGIRAALGADARALVRLSVLAGLVPAGAGMMAGVIAAVVVSGWIRSLLYEVDPLDPLTLSVTAAAVFALAVAATYMPARRAARLDPLLALRDRRAR